MLRAVVLIVLVLGALSGVGRETYGRPAGVLLSNGDPPSERLLGVNFTQRQVAQGFTTGPRPAGCDLHAVAVRTEKSNGKHDMGLQGVIRNPRLTHLDPRFFIVLP